MTMMPEQKLLRHTMIRNYDICYGCGLCEEICPKDATWMETVQDETTGRERKVPEVDDAKCVHCGLCASVCMSGSITQEGLDEMIDEMIGEGDEILVFYCQFLNQGAPINQPGPDEFGGEPPLVLSRVQPRYNDAPMPKGVKQVEIRCSGRVGARKLYDMLTKGVKGVLVMSCPPTECEYTRGSHQADLRLNALKMFMADMGLNPDRIRIMHERPASPAAVGEAVEAFASHIRSLA